MKIEMEMENEDGTLVVFWWSLAAFLRMNMKIPRQETLVVFDV